MAYYLNTLWLLLSKQIRCFNSFHRSKFVWIICPCNEHTFVHIFSLSCTYLNVGNGCVLTTDQTAIATRITFFPLRSSAPPFDWRPGSKYQLHMLRISWSRLQVICGVLRLTLKLFLTSPGWVPLAFIPLFDSRSNVGIGVTKVYHMFPQDWETGHMFL